METYSDRRRPTVRGRRNIQTSQQFTYNLDSSFERDA